LVVLLIKAGDIAQAVAETGDSSTNSAGQDNKTPPADLWWRRAVARLTGTLRGDATVLAD